MGRVAVREREAAGGHDQHPDGPRLHPAAAGGRYTGEQQ